MSLVIRVTGTKEAQKLCRSLSGRELQNRTRRGTRAGAKVFRTKVRAEAKSRSDIPDSFAKTKTRGHRTPVGTSTGPTSPLLNIFEQGAGQHTIAPGWQGSGRGTTTRGARAGTFTGRLLMSGKGGEHYRSRDFVSGEPVSHPGMGARPLIGPVFDSEQEKASQAAMDEFLRGLR